MKVISVIGVVIFRKKVVAERRITAIRFIWIPGMRPVSVPARIPVIIANGIEINIV